ncbi:MAG: alpha/beta hydrolase [Leptospiraceae bacterium]|nr:alpha/beta hydrolase [Leptospiraceae bacterium]
MSKGIFEHQRNGKYVSVEGLNIFNIDKGQGEVIVLLPGFFSTSYSFRKLIPILAENFRVLAPDYPGIGLSERTSAVYSHRMLANMIKQYLDTVTEERVHLVGYDYGCAISFLLLNTYPEKIKTFTAISPFTHLENFTYYTPLFLLHKKVLGDMLGFTMSKNLLKFVFERYLLNTKLDDETLEDYHFLLFHGEGRKNYLKMSHNIDRSIYARKDMEAGMHKMIGGRQILIGENDRNISFKELENIKLFLRLSMQSILPGKRLLMEDSPIDCAIKIESLVKTFSKRT